MTLIFIKHKNGNAEIHKIKRFTMVGSTIRVETEDDVFYIDYSNVEYIKIINP